MKTGPKLSIALSVVFLLLSSPTSAQAARLQQDDPVRQCAEGVQYYRSGQYEIALPLLEAGFDHREEATFANPDDLGECALVLGRLYRARGLVSKALEVELVALNVFRESNDLYYVSSALQEIGIAYRLQGRYAEALESYQEALRISRETGNRDGEGASLANIATVYSIQGKTDEALESYQQALIIAREVDNKQGVSYTLGNIGLIYDDQGRYAEALENYEEALAIAREVGDRIGESIMLDNIGSAYEHQGQSIKALENYLEALAIAREVGDRTSEGTVLNNISLVYETQGRYAEALESCQQALAIAREVENLDGESAALNNIGLIYDDQGRSAEALESYKQALAIRRKLGDPIGEATALANIGAIYIWQQRYADALENYQAALDIYRQSGSRVAEGGTLNSMGLVFEQQGQYAEALDAYQQALIIAREVGSRTDEATTLGQIGTINQLRKDYSEALGAYQQALTIAREVGDRAVEARMLSNIGTVHQDQGEYAEALNAYQESITIHEGIRATAGSESARASYLESFAFIYTWTIDLYYQQSQLEKAFVTAERGRARAFLDSIATSYVDLSDKIDVALLQQESEAYAKRQTAQDALTKAKTQHPSDLQLISDLETQLTQAEKDYVVALDAVTARSDQLAQLVPGRSKVLDVSQVQALLDDKTTLVSFWVLGDSTLAFVLDRTNFNVVSLGIGEGELAALVSAFRDFSNIEESHPESLIKLYAALITPLKPYLKTQNLIIVPHSVLHYLPFSALTDGQHYLIDDYEIGNLPSASALPFIQQNAQETAGQPLILGNPATGDYDATASFATERDELGPLPFAEEEAKNIAALLGVQPHLETDATETLVRQQASQTSALHLAAHAVFNPAAPLSSLIALAPDQENDGWLTVGEVYGLDLKNTDLVVLSACDTQMGQLTAGDEFVGLTRAFFFAGTPTVVASLWSVDDQATALLMERFYAHLQEGMGKAEALRQAQIDVREKYPNPYFWAAFVLSGDPNHVKEIKLPQEQPAKVPINLPCSGALIVLLLILRFLHRGIKQVECRSPFQRKPGIVPFVSGRK